MGLNANLLRLANGLLRRHARFLVEGESMLPTLAPGDAVFVDTAVYRYELPRAGDVVACRHPRHDDFVRLKRIIGVPGERLRVHDGSLLVNGQPLYEPYAAGDAGRDLDVQLGADEYFVVGDQRSASTDSRSFGPLRLDRIVGRVEFRYLPGARRGRLATPRRAVVVPGAVSPDGWTVYRGQQQLGAVLAGWGMASVLAGAWLRRQGGPFVSGAGGQFIAWGAVDAAIGAAGVTSGVRAARRWQAGEFRVARLQRDRALLERVLWINAGLDVGYCVAGAALLLDRRNRLGRRGAGAGVLAQGAFLLGFDVANALRLRERSLERPARRAAAPRGDL